MPSRLPRGCSGSACHSRRPLCGGAGLERGACRGLMESVGAANVSSVVATCTVQSFTVGGSLGGLIGSGLVLQDNGGNNLAIAANGSFAFSASVDSGSAYAVTIKTQPTNPSQTCVLSATSGTVGAANVSNVVVTCTSRPGQFAYLPSSLGIYSYAIDAMTGALTALADSPSGASGVGPGIAVDPAGMFAYATLSKIDNVIAYAIDSSTGNLTAISGSQFYGGGGNPLDITVDPSGQFASMANYGGGISAFTINSVTGGLTAVSGSPFPTAVAAREFGMQSVTVDPTGKFVYAASQTGSDVSAYVIDSSTGALTTVVGSPFPSGSAPQTVRVDPSGKYVYVANPKSNNVWAYSINGSTGALSMIAAYPSDSSRQGSPYGLAIEPSGRFLYVANGNSRAISAFTIDNSTGVLTPLSGNPIATGSDPGGRLFIQRVSFST